MNKKTLKIFLGISLLIPTLAYCGLWDYVIGNRLKMNEMKSFAKNYAEQKYHRDYEVVGLDWELKQVRVKPKDNSSDACWVLVSTDDSNWSAKSDCGYHIITRKIVKDINRKIISKDFSNNDIRISFTCKDGTRCGLPKSQLIGDYWNLSAEAWLKKFYKYLQVDGVSINVFEVERSPENIVKLMEMVRSLNKELYEITGTHIIQALTLKAYEGSVKDIRKEQKDVWSHKYANWFLYSETNCKARRLKANSPCGNDLVDLKNMNVQQLLDFSSEFTYLTSEDRRKQYLLKDTKYYSQVKNILSNDK
jgi:hypothetical protein